MTSTAIAMPASFAAAPSRPSIRAKVSSSTSMPGMCSCMWRSMRVLRGGVTPTSIGARSVTPASSTGPSHSAKRPTS